jgi:hypothetical protein
VTSLVRDGECASRDGAHASHMGGGSVKVVRGVTPRACCAHAEDNGIVRLTLQRHSRECRWVTLTDTVSKQIAMSV